MALRPTKIELIEAGTPQYLLARPTMRPSTLEPFNRFTDALATHEVELNFKYIIQVSLHRRLTYAGRPPVKSAILATDATAIHYGQLHSVLTQGSPIKVRVFQDREEAAQWLCVPIERLTEDAASSETL